MANFGREADVLIGALITAFNDLHDVVTSSSGFALDGYHKDQTWLVDSIVNPLAPVLSVVTVTAASASDLPTTVVLANQVRGVLKQHMLDDSAHLKADLVNDGYLDGYSAFMDGYSASQSPSFGAAELVLVCNILNVCKKAFNDHRTQSGVHVTDDNGNSVTASTATDLASAETLANAIKSALNLHMGSAPSGLPRISVEPF